VTRALLPLLLTFALLAFASWRWWGRSSSGATGYALGWAVTKGLMPGDPPLPGSTPTLSLPGGTANDPWQVPIGDATGLLFQWTWVIADDRTTTEREMDMPGGVLMGSATVVQATLAAGFPHFRVVPRHGWTAPSPAGHERELELESVEFARHFKLLVAPDGDHEMLMELFDPETIVWLIGLGKAAPVIEYQMGTLAVVAHRECVEGADFDALLSQAQRIAERVLAEGLLHHPDAPTPA
jgi:hypothetical protein